MGYYGQDKLCLSSAICNAEHTPPLNPVLMPCLLYSQSQHGLRCIVSSIRSRSESLKSLEPRDDDHPPRISGHASQVHSHSCQTTDLYPRILPLPFAFFYGEQEIHFQCPPRCHRYHLFTPRSSAQCCTLCESSQRVLIYLTILTSQYQIRRCKRNKRARRAEGIHATSLLSLTAEDLAGTGSSRNRNRNRTGNTTTDATTTTTTTTGARRGRRSRGRALRRTESGRSVKTLPEYSKEAGDEELVLVR
jgi:hypothetical protein